MWTIVIDNLVDVKGVDSSTEVAPEDLLSKYKAHVETELPTVEDLSSVLNMLISLAIGSVKGAICL